MQSPPSLVGVRTGWLHRAGQEARGCSQRCLVLLIVFLKVQIKGWWLGLEKQATWLLVNSDLPPCACSVTRVWKSCL